MANCEAFFTKVSEKLAQRSARWFLGVAIGCGILGLVMVPVLEWLLHEAGFSWWLHIPLTGLALTLIPLGASGAGIAYREYQVRLARGGQQA